MPTCSQTPQHFQRAPNCLCAKKAWRNQERVAARWGPRGCTHATHLHHHLQALRGHVSLQEARQQILEGVHGVLVQGLEGEEAPVPQVSPLPTAAFPLPPPDAGQWQGARSDTSWPPSSPSGSGSTAMTLCRQPWIMSACSCSSSAGSRELSHRLRASPAAPTAARRKRKHCAQPPPRAAAPQPRREERIHQVSAGQHGLLANG